uniref:Uncharacterized protein n=1 Tax=Zea mays TaxID=4577 RepID=B6TQ60_MAIZE|nr:hypothetical protein [Zea mays]|eukprot:NP_001144281.1 uncharacterized protein LOC100277160 [Zea mays]
MGKKIRSTDGTSTPARSMNQAVSLREETSGRTRVDDASLLRVKHLQRLAAWAGPEAGVRPIGALLGRRLAASAEAAGVPLNAATFLCQRCETILKPGFNCTVRIRNKRNKAKRRKKSNCCQNSVSYACHFCGDQNLILGSGKGVVQSLLLSRGHATMNSSHIIVRGNGSNTRAHDKKEVLELSQAAILQVESSSLLRQSTTESDEHGERLNCNLDEQMRETSHIFPEKVRICEATLQAELAPGSSFVTPQKMKPPVVTVAKDSAGLLKTGSGMISGSAIDALSGSSKSASNGSRNNVKYAARDSSQVSGSSRKRARKGWTTLKQMAEKDELERKEKMGNFVIPFFMQ